MGVDYEKDLKKYEDQYTEDGFFNKISRFAQKAGIKAVYYVLILYQLLKSGAGSIADKAMIIGALGYFISPFDFIPDLLPLTGFVDDVSILVFVLTRLSSFINAGVKGEAKRRLRQWFDFNDADIDKMI